LACSPKFRNIDDEIKKKQFSGNHSEIAKELNYAVKIAGKMVNSHKQVYLINRTMQAEIDFIRQALTEGSGIPFEVPIAFIIPRTPAASLFGDSSLLACGGYSTALQVWWYISFPDEIIQQTLLHLSNNQRDTFISINCLNVTIIINYCMAITALLKTQVNNNPHPVVLCVTDNISAKNWMLHTSKIPIIGCALARFFCGLLISLDVGINAKWISTAANKIADKISRIKKSNTPLSFHYDFSPNSNRTMRS
jgi:hypothetical protein